MDFCDGAVFVSDGERKIFVTAGLSVRPPKGATVVSCGMSERDSVSVSSVAEGSAMISVRRALPVLGGGEACVQEIAVRRRVDTDVLALRAASLLCIGIPPEDLGKLL